MGTSVLRRVTRVHSVGKIGRDKESPSLQAEPPPAFSRQVPAGQGKERQCQDKDVLVGGGQGGSVHACARVCEGCAWGCSCVHVREGERRCVRGEVACVCVRACACGVRGVCLGDTERSARPRAGRLHCWDRAQAGRPGVHAPASRFFWSEANVGIPAWGVRHEGPGCHVRLTRWACVQGS